MKKLIVIAAVCLVLGSILGSCNREVCPAYTQADTEQAAEIA